MSERRGMARAWAGVTILGLTLSLSCGGESEPAASNPAASDPVAREAVSAGVDVASRGIADFAAKGRAETPDASSVSALAAGGDVTFAGFSHVCAAVGGDLQCWGANGVGQLGDGVPSVRAPLPVRVSGMPLPISQLAAGGTHSCALAAGEVHCWGHNGARQLGAERPSLRVRPERVDGLPEPVTSIAAGRRHSCAVAAGALWCWGTSESGELGFAPGDRCRGVYGAHPCTATPARVPGLPLPVEAAALGSGHSCALAAGEVFCWGRNRRGQLGDGGFEDRTAPRAVELPGTVRDLAAGADHSCATLDAGVWCWGANERGQLGDGSLDDRAEPVRVVEPLGVPEEPGAPERLAAGGAGTCTRTGTEVRCWGAALPDGVPATRPRRISGLGRATGDVAVGVDVACAVVDAARVRCWGENDYGQLGDGSAPKASPTAVAVGPWDDGRIRDLDGDGRITVACLGDSNTQRTNAVVTGWCERLEALLGGDGSGPLEWRTVNRGWGGAAAIAGSLRPAHQQLRYSLENDRPDVIVMAYGTNDLRGDARPGEVFLAYAQLRQQVRAAGASFFVATTPPTLPPEREVNAAIDELNALIENGFPADRVIDFRSGVGAEDFSDGIHLSDAGHERRARAAASSLSAAAPVAAP